MSFIRSLSLLALGVAAPLLGARAQSAATFYDPATVQEITLTFPQTNWDYQLDTAKAGSESYLLATQCVINGVVFDSVGVKYKGNSSYNANNAKNPLHIELNWQKNQAYGAVTDLKLANGFADPSMVREALSYAILHQFMEAPRANFARVTVNGAYYGLMTNVENIGKQFLTDNFYSSSGTFVKCTPVGGAGPGSNAYPDLRYLGAAQNLYAASYEVKPDDVTNWANVVNLCDTLNRQPAALDHVLDVDRALWMLAFNNVLVNLDSYTGAFRQNYYLYRDADHRFRSVMWDLNMSFGGFPNLLNGGGGPGGGGALDTTGMKNLIPGANATDANHPLIQRIWSTPRWKRMYVAHMKAIAQELANPAWLAAAQQLQTTITPALTADTHKFYSMAQFTQNLQHAISGGGGGPGGGRQTPGIFRLITGRLAYLNGTAEFTAVAPVIAQPVATPAAPLLNDTTWITATLTTPGGAQPTSAVLLNWRADHTRRFRQVAMADDGLHHDGAAADGTYGAALVAAALQLEYFVYAENSAAGIFSPVRAEHEFYTLTATAPLPAGGAVVLNELLADNATGQTPQGGTQQDWLELFNTTPQPVNLTGLYLSDDRAVPNKWTFPAGTVIAPGGYLTVWADNGTSTADELHANFKLSKNGESLIFSDGGTTVLDSISFGAQATDSTWGRLPNGTGPWRRLPPTFNAENQLTVTGLLTDAGTRPVALYPNPASTTVTVRGAGPGEEITLTNAVGQTVRRQRATAEAVLVSTADLPAGIYSVRVGARAARRLAVAR